MSAGVADPGTAAPPSGRRRFGPWVREEVLLGLEVAALVGFAITQPVLDVFGRAPDVFVFENAQRRDILAFAVLFSVVAAGAALLPGLLAGLVRPAARLAVHVATLGVLAGVVVVRALDRYADLAPALVTVVAAAAALGVAAARVRFGALRDWLRFASPAPLVFAAIFLLVSPVSKLVFPESVAALDVDAVRDAPPVVLVVFDEFPLVSLVDRNGQIDRDLFPNFARLADMSTFFTGASTMSPATWNMVPAILSGKYPRDGTVPIASDHPDNLFTMLGGQYHLEVFEAITRLCPVELCPIQRGGHGFRGMARLGLRTLRELATPGDSTADPNASLVEEQAAAEAGGDGGGDDEEQVEFDAFERSQPERFTQFLESIRTAPEPAVHYLHILLPHTPWRFLPSGLTYQRPRFSPGQVAGRWSDQEWPTAVNRQRHLIQVQYTDRLVGELLDRLEERGLLDRALLVMTADHGVAFTPGAPLKGNKEEELSPEILPEMMFVPLFVKVPGQERGEVREQPVLNIDILPTIADVLGVDPPYEMDGRSVLGPPRTDRTRPWFQSYDSALVGVNLGDRYDLPDADVRPDLDELGVDVFAPDDGPLRMYRVGPYGDLVGREVTSLPEGPDPGVEGFAEQRDLYEDVDVEHGPLPSFVNGRLTGAVDDEDGAAVAIAVNGTIGAVSPLFVNGERPHSFAGLVPDSLLHAGGNDLSLHLVRGPRGDRTLAPVPLTDL